MGNYKYLLKNVGLLTLSSFATKLLSFFLVPLYTNILTTTDYGTYDLFNNTVVVLLPILTLNIQDAVLRFSMDDEYDDDAVITIAYRYLFFSNLIVIVGLVLNNIFSINLILKQYAIYFFLMFLTQSLSGVITYYIRGIGEILELSISSLLASAITVVCNILFLVIFDWGLTGYFLANLLGPLYQCIYLILRTKLVHSIKIHVNFNKEKKQMLDYCTPLIANSIAWWVNNTSDRYIVIFFCGLADNGIYAVSSKIPSILNMFQTIFGQAWSLSAVHDFDKDDKNGFFSNTYKVYNCILVIICSIIIVFDKVFAKILYAKEFYIAWKYVPWLTIAIVFGALSGYIGGVFSAVKDSKIFAHSSIIGAITNIMLNIIFTPIIGALGAAIATMICYFEVWILRYVHSKKFIRIKVNLVRDCISYFLLVIQSIILLLLNETIMLYGTEIILLCIIIAMYFGDIVNILIKIKNNVFEGKRGTR